MAAWVHPGLGQDEKNALRACTRIWRWLLQGKNNRPPKGVEHGPPSACFAACALRLRRPARRLGRLHGVGRAAPRPPGGFAPLRGLNGHAGTPSVDQGREERVFQTVGGSGSVGRRPEAVGSGEAGTARRAAVHGWRAAVHTASGGGGAPPPATPAGVVRRRLIDLQRKWPFSQGNPGKLYFRGCGSSWLPGSCDFVQRVAQNIQSIAQLERR